MEEGERGEHKVMRDLKRQKTMFSHILHNMKGGLFESKKWICEKGGGL